MKQEVLIPVDVLNKYSQAQILEVDGDEMAPVLMTNDVILVDPTTKPRPNAKDLSVFRLGYQLHVCRYFKYGGQIVMLYDAGRPRTVRADDVEIVGKVVWGDYENEESQPAANELAFN